MLIDQDKKRSFQIRDCGSEIYQADGPGFLIFHRCVVEIGNLFPQIVIDGSIWVDHSILSILPNIQEDNMLAFCASRSVRTQVCVFLYL